MKPCEGCSKVYYKDYYKVLALEGAYTRPEPSAFQECVNH